MAVFAFTDAYFVLNSVNLSDHIKSITATFDGAVLDSTAMGDTWTESTGGVKSGSFSITFNDDIASGSVDATIWPLLGTTTTFEFRMTSSAVGASNPKWTGSVFVGGTSAGGGHGELAAKSVTWPTSGTITRATA